MNKLVDRLHKHKNDCWCDAIALATNRDYEDVYNEYKHLINDDGGLNIYLTQGILFKYGYKKYNIESTTLKNVLDLPYLKSGVLIDITKHIDGNGHIIFAKDDMIFDISDMPIEEYIESYNATAVYFRDDDLYE